MEKVNAMQDAEISPLQRAANAIEHEFIELASPDDPVSPYGIAHRVARAVLQAIRQPSDAMFDAARKEAWAAGTSIRQHEIEGIFVAMIDAALEEGR
jgi:hypothetical protein